MNLRICKVPGRAHHCALEIEGVFEVHAIEYDIFAVSPSCGTASDQNKHFILEVFRIIAFPTPSVALFIVHHLTVGISPRLIGKM